MKLITFAEALSKTARYKKRHMVLGNGFSIACKPDIFSYRALFEQAAFTSAQDLTRTAFDVPDTRDFEEVTRALSDAARPVRSGGPAYNAVAHECMKAVA